MILADVIAAVHRYRARVQTQAQLARDIQHLREVARMLVEDKPDKIKAVEAVNDIAAKRLVRMDPGARSLLAAAMPSSACGIDHGDLMRWLMTVNPPGQFPYTQGVADPGAPAAEASGCSRLLGRTEQVDDDPETHLAAALAEGWAWLDADPDETSRKHGVDALSLQIAIEFDEHRDARNGALARAARRLWAVSLREHFGVSGDGLKLALIATRDPSGIDNADHPVDDSATDQAEDRLLVALQAMVKPSASD